MNTAYQSLYAAHVAEVQSRWEAALDAEYLQAVEAGEPADEEKPEGEEEGERHEQPSRRGSASAGTPASTAIRPTRHLTKFSRAFGSGSVPP